MDTLEKIRTLQRSRNWSKYMLAKKADLPQSTVFNMFKRNNTPTYPTLKAIAKAFDVPPSTLIDEDSERIALTGRQKELINLFSALPPESQNIILKMVKAMYDDACMASEEVAEK